MSADSNNNNNNNIDDNDVTFHIAGDAYVDFFCFLDGDWPENGGDSRLDQPVKSYAGGSSTNTATHLKSLVQNFFVKQKNDNGMQRNNDNDNVPDIILQTVLNPNDHYGQLLVQHAKKHDFPLLNCRKDKPPQQQQQSKEQNNNNGNNTSDTIVSNIDTSKVATGHCIAIVSGGERSFMTHQGCVQDFEATDLNTTVYIETPTNLHLHFAGFFNIPGFWNGKLKTTLEYIRNQRTERHPTKNTTLSLVTQHDATREWDGGLDQVLPLLDFAIMNDLEARHIVTRGNMKNNGDNNNINNIETSCTDNNDNATATKNEFVEWAAYFQKVCPNTIVIVTQGKEGAVALQNGQLIAQQEAKKVVAVDPTGAGDSFSAGFIFGIWTWKRINNNNYYKSQKDPWPIDSIKEGLRWGCAVGTSSILIRGASVPAAADDIQKLYNESYQK